MPLIARLIGGAGTGKTSDQLNTMAKTIEAGISPWLIGFVSFTRAARAEAAQRAAQQFGLKQEELEKEGWFKTLHSICYRALGDRRGKLLTGGKEGREWLANALQTDVGALDEPESQDLAECFLEGQTEAGMALRIWNAARNRLEPLSVVWEEAAAIDERTPDLQTCRSIVDRYELHKALDNRPDFTDLAGRFAGWRFDPDEPWPCEAEGDCPDLPVWFFDEQQDTSRLLDSVCRRLTEAPSCRWVYLAGDPFQSIYSFAGANPDCFREWEVAKERIMPKSYRCSAEILEAGEASLRECSDYFDRGIKPAEHSGEVEYCWWQNSLPREINPTESWLLIARTNRLAAQLAQALDRQGLPWVPTRGMGGWRAPKRQAALNALLALEKGHAVADVEWRQALDLIPAKIEGGELLKRGTKSSWAETSPKAAELANLESLPAWGATPLLCDLIRSKQWRGVIEGGEKFSSVWERWGFEAALDPKVKVGTIHSVKGAEADNVLLLTTSTHQCDRAMQNVRMADEERRVAYVGITRARRRLILAKERNARFRMPMP